MTVELLGGRGEELWPWPGRIFAVGPPHTFLDLANAINDAFARWDRAHVSVFSLGDGRVVTDEQTGAEMTASPEGPIMLPIDIASAKVARTVEPGAEFQFTFDLGDSWTHRCVVAHEKVDPVDLLGGRSRAPLPYWGWGDIPDQYGRRWAGDDGKSRPPQRPNLPHPMLLHSWPTRKQLPSVDLGGVRVAVAGNDADRFLAAVTGSDIDDALQQVGAGIPMALEQRRNRAEAVALSVVNRLMDRGAAGDHVLAEDLLACLRGKPLAGAVVPVDLDMLSTELEGDLSLSTGGYIDLHTGEVYDENVTDQMMVGEDGVIDVEDDPERWLRFNRTGSRDGWQDMADFAERQWDSALHERLESAIHGGGAFRRFRDLIHDENLAEQWDAFSTDRHLGRSRAFLAREGIRVRR